MSKIENLANKLLNKLLTLKNWGLARLCSLWQKYSPQLKQLDFAKAKAFTLKYKWRILAVIIALYAASKAYDYFFPAADKAGGPITVTTMVVEKKDVPLILEATGTIVSNKIVDIRPMITNTVTEILVKDGQGVKAGD